MAVKCGMKRTGRLRPGGKVACPGTGSSSTTRDTSVGDAVVRVNDDVRLAKSLGLINTGGTIVATDVEEVLPPYYEHTAFLAEVLPNWNGS